MNALDKPNVTLPLAASYNQRGIAGYTAAFTDAIDQRKINCVYEVYKNALSEKVTLRLVKRPGVADVGSNYGTSSQLAYLTDIAAGAGTNAATNRWVFSTSGNDIRASDTANTTVIATAAGYEPVYVDKTQISGIDTVVVQFRNASGTQTAWHASTIGTFFQVTSSVFTTLAHQGKLEHLDGFAFQSTRNRIYNSGLNTLFTWPDTNYIARQVTQDIGTGLAKLGTQILSFGTATMEVYRNAGNRAGSPLVAVPGLAQDYGLPSTIVTGMRHYYTVVDGFLYWRGTPTGVYAYNGQTVEKVSNQAVDKILAERQHYFVGRTTVKGQRAIVIGLDTPSAVPQRGLLFFPKWRDWFEWSSSTFIPSSSPRLDDVFIGVSSSPHRLFALSNSSNNWRDAGIDFTMTTQFKLPAGDNHKQHLDMYGVVGDTASSSTTSALSVSLTYDDWQTTTAARTIDMTSAKKHLYRGGAFRSLGVRLEHTGNLDCALDKFVARVR